MSVYSSVDRINQQVCSYVGYQYSIRESGPDRLFQDVDELPAGEVAISAFGLLGVVDWSLVDLCTCVVSGLAPVYVRQRELHGVCCIASFRF
jgi:hypothetical protein